MADLSTYHNGHESPQVRRNIAPGERLGPVVEVALMGGLTLSLRGHRLEVISQKARALVGFLALTRTTGATRESLCGLLWSESSEDLARTSLRQALRSLRRGLGSAFESVLHAGRTAIGLNLDHVRLDVADIMADVERGRIPEVLLAREGLAETLFAGMEDLDPAFLAWLRIQRATLGERLVKALENRLTIAGSVHDRRACAEALGNLDRTHEGACRVLMRLHAEGGDTLGALRHYKRLWDLLDTEYGAEPSEETQALVAAIKQGTLTAGQPGSHLPVLAAQTSERTLEHVWPRRAPNGERLRLAIGHFKTEGLGPEKQYLVDGFRQELVAKLLRFREWIIVDGEWQGMADGERGRTCYQLFAAVRSDGDLLYLLLTLYDQYNGEYVWSERHPLSLSGWFEAQQNILRRIAVGVNVHLSAQRLLLIAGQSEISLQIHDRWLLAQALLQRWQPEADTHAEAILRAAIEDAPRFAPAYSSLVQILNAREVVFPGIRRRRETDLEAMALARLAVQLDPLDSRTHLCAAWACANSGYFHAAELSFLVARDLNENDPWTLVSTALGLAYSASYDLAGATAAQALAVGLRLSPLHWGYHAGIHFLRGDYDACVRAAERAQGLPRYVSGWKAAALGQLGDIEPARAEARAFCELIRAHWRGEGAATDAAVVAWFLGAFPIRDDHAWERLRDGLRLAGLPVATDQARAFDA